MESDQLARLLVALAKLNHDHSNSARSTYLSLLQLLPGAVMMIFGGAKTQLFITVPPKTHCDEADRIHPKVALGRYTAAHKYSPNYKHA